jgi:FixJ family two-component response regulator
MWSDFSYSAPTMERRAPIENDSPSGTVYIVDDDPAILRALGRLVRSAGLSAMTFESPMDFLESSETEAAGCVILDVRMPGLDGLELQNRILDRSAERPVIFLTAYGDIPMAVRAMKSGAVDFLSKPCDDEILMATIQLALKRSRKAKSIRALIERLTPREFQVMKGVVAGQLNKHIADDLGTVEQTIKVHRSRVMEKLEVDSVAALVRLAITAGIKAE